MLLTKTFDDPNIVPPMARGAWEFMESNSACAIMKAVCPEEWADIVEVLSNYRLDPSSWLKKGGNRGDVPEQIDEQFQKRGWQEARLDLETKTIIFDKNEQIAGDLPAIRQEGYLVDNFKNRIVLDVEWAAKDGNLDRDLAAYRAWYEAGAIAAGVIITRDRIALLELARALWRDYQSSLPDDAKSSKLPIDLTTSTTTTLDKAAMRMRRGVMGTCPVLIVGASAATWNGKPFAK